MKNSLYTEFSVQVNLSEIWLRQKDISHTPDAKKAVI